MTFTSSVVANNNSSGQIIVAAGIVNTQNLNSIGLGTGAKVVASGATLQFAQTGTAVNVGQTIVLVGGTLESVFGANIASGVPLFLWYCPAPSRWTPAAWRDGHHQWARRLDQNRRGHISADRRQYQYRSG